MDLIFFVLLTKRSYSTTMPGDQFLLLEFDHLHSSKGVNVQDLDWIHSRSNAMGNLNLDLVQVTVLLDIGLHSNLNCLPMSNSN